MSSHYCSMFPRFTDLMSDQLYKELVKSECLTTDDPQDVDDNFYDINELEEVFADHILIGKRLQKTLYRGNIEDLDENTDHPPIALTDLALKLFSKAVPNYGLDLLDMDYVSSVSEATRVSPCAMILALIYLERLQIKNNDYLESVSPSGLFVVTMLVASKFLFEDEDDIVTNQIWAEALNIDVKELNRLEQHFLSAIDWKLYVNSSDYFQYLSSIEKMIAVKHSSLRGWLSYSDAYSILQDAVVRKFLISCIESIIKVSAISALGYVVTVLSVYAAGFALHCRYNKSAISELTVGMKNCIQLQRSIPGTPNIEFTSDIKIATEESTAEESILSKLSSSNKNNFYEDKKFNNELKNFECMYSNQKQPSVLCGGMLQSSLKVKYFYCTHFSKDYFQNKLIFANHTLYRLQLWPENFKNTYISVLIE